MNIEGKNHIRTKDQINEIIKRKHLINIYDKDDRIEEEMLKALMKGEDETEKMNLNGMQ